MSGQSPPDDEASPTPTERDSAVRLAKSGGSEPDIVAVRRRRAERSVPPQRPDPGVN